MMFIVDLFGGWLFVTVIIICGCMTVQRIFWNPELEAKEEEGFNYYPLEEKKLLAAELAWKYYGMDLEQEK